ncbi:MAG TPA: hypothetical protein VM143_01585 [Acidimicrobiales bacterium]|nr:hypothetical protein [Acidimicrobiales bacterium]
MVGIGDGQEFCRGCGRTVAACGGSCGRDRPTDPARFCTRCGWRLREIAVVPGLGSLWCREHGVVID